MAPDETEPDRLSAEQACDAMFCFLDRYWREFKTAITDVLGDIQPARDGKSSDPAEWHRWLECVRQVFDRAPSS